MVIEVFWFTLSVYGVVMYFRRKKDATKTFGVSRGEQDSKEKLMDDIL